MALKPEETSIVKKWIDSIKKFYVLKIKGFDEHKMSALTLAFEGNEQEVLL
jgi:alkyldihydroxyacetonephosphate synthase